MKETRVVKPRLQIYDIELEVRRTLEAGLIKFDDRELRNENETRKEVKPGGGWVLPERAGRIGRL